MPHTGEKLDLILQCSKCLDDLHKINVVHGDVKPENFLVKKASDGISVRLSDFGLSTCPDTPPADGRRGPGTTSYMAPELAGRISFERGNWNTGVEVPCSYSSIVY